MLSSVVSVLIDGPRFIEQTIETKIRLAFALARQWFGVYITPEAPNDEWLLDGLAEFLTDTFIRKYLGNNEAHYRRYKTNVTVCQADDSGATVLSSDAASKDLYGTQCIGFYGKMRLWKSVAVLQMLEKQMGPESFRKDGSKFPEVHAFELAYAGKNKCWTDNIAKTQYDEMLVKIDEYLLQKVKEQQLPEDTPLEEIPVDDPEAGLNIMMSVLGEKPGRQIRGLGNGRLRNIRTTSHVRNLEQELEVERTARKAADASRVKMEERMQNKLKVVGRKFNSTLQSLHHSMQQICHNIPGFVMPPFTPLSIDEAFEEDGDVEGEENNFEEEHNFDEDE